jgi:hypothetical protein
VIEIGGAVTSRKRRKSTISLAVVIKLLIAVTPKNRSVRDVNYTVLNQNATTRVVPLSLAGRGRMLGR